MNDNRSFDWGMVAGMLLIVAAQAGNWLITPMSHPDAGSVRRGFVVAQAVVCTVAVVGIIYRYRSRHAV